MHAARNLPHSERFIMNTPTTDFLLRLEDELEADVLECLRILELGLEDAVRELHKSRDVAGAALAEAKRHLSGTAATSQRHLEAIQQSLGSLSTALHDFILTDPLEIEDLEAFDTWRDRLLAAFEDARKELNRIQSHENPEWRAPLERAWRRLAQTLELVKLRLGLDRDRAEQELEAERARLRQRLGDLQQEIRRDPQSARQTFEKMAGTRQDDPEVSRLEGWFKALLMWIDYPATDRRREREERGEE